MKFWFGKKEESNEAEGKTQSDAGTASAPAPVSAVAPTPQRPITLKPASGTPPPPAAEPERPAAARAQPSPNERKALYYQMMNALYDAVLVVDDNGHIVDCNNRVESMIGHTKEDLWDAPVTDVVPAINAQIFHQMKDGLHGQHRVLVNAQCKRKDGTTFHCEIGAGLMELIGENLVLTIRNIEKRKAPPEPKKPAMILKTRSEAPKNPNQD